MSAAVWGLHTLRPFKRLPRPERPAAHAVHYQYNFMATGIHKFTQNIFLQFNTEVTAQNVICCGGKLSIPAIAAPCCLRGVHTL